jgi:hypothetical protein
MFKRLNVAAGFLGCQPVLEVGCWKLDPGNCAPVIGYCDLEKTANRGKGFFVAIRNCYVGVF